MKLQKLLAIFLILMLLNADLSAIAATSAALQLPQALKIVDEEAFCGSTSIGKVVVPEGTAEIRARAFADSSLTEIELPGTLTFIADDAFEGCSDFTLTAQEGTYAYEWALGMGYLGATPASCFSTELLEDGTLAITGYTGEDADVIIPSRIGGVQVTVLGDSAFESASISSIVIPEGVTTIGGWAFSECAFLTSVSLPAGLQTIGDLAFQSTGLIQVTIPDSVTALGWSIFNNCSSLVNAVIPTSVTSVGGTAIRWDEAGTGITISGDVDMYAFHNWTEIKSVVIEDGCTFIGEGAFMDCLSLQRVVLPESVTAMESRVFAGCSSLTEVNIPAQVTELGDFVFDSCSFESIALPEGLETIGTCAFQCCRNLLSIEIPDGVQAIGSYAFALCESLGSVTLPGSVTEIPSMAFMGCAALKSISLPETIAFIEADAFSECPDLTASVVEDSYAHRWCVENGVACVPYGGPLKIKTQPQDVTAPVGTAAEISVIASGSGLSYLWQYSDDNGATWYDDSTAGAVLPVTVTEELHGRLVRCVVSDANGEKAITGSARILVQGMLKIIIQPEEIFCEEGDTAAFEIAAAGTGLTYEWQFSDDDGAAWTAIDGANAAIYSLSASAGCHGRMVRCIVTDADGNTAISEAVRLIIGSLLGITIVEPPQDALCSIGDTVELSVTADGFGLHYLWQYSADGSEWFDTDTSLNVCTLAATEETFGRMYRCRVWDSYGNSYTTDAVRIFDETVLILSQPQNWTGCESGKAFFEVVVLDSVVTCQWQISKNNGEKWSNSSVVTPYYATAAAEKNGWLYRCIATDAEGRQQISDTVMLTITDEFSIAAQPKNRSGKLGESVTFAIQAGGTDVGFEWQRSTDGESWTTLASNQARIYQTITTTSIGRYYRCIVTNSDGSTLTSETVQLRWNCTGFFTYNEKLYYAREDGRIAMGLETIGSDLYYFSDYGVMLTGLRRLDSGIYYFTDEGPAARGFVYVPEEFNTFYFGADHAAAIGWTEIGQDTYYFYDTGAMARGVTQIGENEYFFDHDTGAQTYGMVQVGFDAYMYFLEGEDLPFAGLKEVDGALYYFCDVKYNYGVSLGSMQTVGDKTYYFDPKTKQAVTGFVTYNNNVYFMGSDYVMVTDSFVKDGSCTYLFSANGTMRYGLVYYNGNTYYFDPETGAAASGWMELDGSRLYFDPQTHAAKTGLADICGEKYYFTSSGYLSTGVITVDDTIYYFAPEGEIQTGFVEVRKNMYYVFDDRTVATGLTTVDGELYYFDSIGVMKTGFRIIDDMRYYFDPATGAAVTGIAQMSNGNTYYFNGASGTGSGLTEVDGALYNLTSNGIVQYGRAIIDNNIYYFDPTSGQAVAGWRSIQGSDGVMRRAYFDPESFCAAKGLREIDGKLYYFSTSGWALTGKQSVNGVMYYFSPGTLEAYTGWYQDTDGGQYYYDGANGRLVGPGIIQVGDVSYYVNSVGKRLTGLQVIDGARMYFDPVTAQSVDGFVFIEDETSDSGKVYYFDKLKDARYGLQTIDGNTYYFASTGLMRYGLQTIDGVKYYFDELTGARDEGIIYSESNEQYYLFDADSATGVGASVSTVGGVQYAVTSSGTLRTGYCPTSLTGLDYRIYLDPETGEQQLGLIDYVTSSGTSGTCYFQPQGFSLSVNAIRQALTDALASDGWHVVEGLTYYVKDGAFCKGLQTIDGNTYYFSSLSGAMLTGLRRIGGSRYYFDQDTGAMKKGLLIIDGKQFFFDPTTGAQAYGLTETEGGTYYFLESGALSGTVQVGDALYVFQQTGCGQAVNTDREPAPVQPSHSGIWGTIDGAKCFYAMDGNLMTGLNTIDGMLYYFDEYGRMQTGMMNVNGSTYYFGESGAMSGRIEIDGCEYYFSPSSFSMLTGMQKINGEFCYYGENGARQFGWITLGTGERFYMNADGAQTGLAVIDGSTYFFGDNGVMRTGVQQVTTAEDAQITCLFNEDGAMITGFVTMNDGLYHYDPETGARTFGFAELDGAEYYFDSNTGRALTGLRNLNGVYCYFDPETAQRKYGVQNVNGNVYCFTDDPEEPGFASGLNVIDGKTYYFYKYNGVARGGYYIHESERYYFDPVTGESVSGIYRVDSGDVYFFRAGGGVETGWIETDGKTYFFYPATGLMAEGLASVGDKLYYFDFDSGLLRNTTIVSGGVTYQLDENGHASAVGDSNIARLVNAGIATLDKAYGDEGDLEDPTALTCSQLVSYVFNEIGYNVIKRVDRQYYSLLNGEYESEIIEDLEHAKAGDVIFFTTVNCKSGTSCTFWNELHHVGIYLGDGKILESYAIEGDNYNNGPMIRDLIELSNTVIYKLIRIKGVNDL